MNFDSVKSTLELMKNASSIQLVIVSFLILPFIFEKWIVVLKELPVLDNYRIESVLMIFTIFLIISVMGLRKDRRLGELLLAKNQIKNYLISNDFTRMSFDKVREKFNVDYSDSFLKEVVNTFSNELRNATIHPKENNQYLLDEKGEKMKVSGVGIV